MQNHVIDFRDTYIEESNLGLGIQIEDSFISEEQLLEAALWTLISHFWAAAVSSNESFTFLLKKKLVAPSRRPSFSSHLLMFYATEAGNTSAWLARSPEQDHLTSQDKRNSRRARVHETAASLWERCCIFGWYKTIATSSRGGPSVGEVIPQGNRQHLLQTQNREPWAGCFAQENLTQAPTTEGKGSWAPGHGTARTSGLLVLCNTGADVSLEAL